MLRGVRCDILSVQEVWNVWNHAGRPDIYTRTLHAWHATPRAPPSPEDLVQIGSHLRMAISSSRPCGAGSGSVALYENTIPREVRVFAPTLGPIFFGAPQRQMFLLLLVPFPRQDAGEAAMERIIRWVHLVLSDQSRTDLPLEPYSGASEWGGATRRRRASAYLTAFGPNLGVRRSFGLDPAGAIRAPCG